MQGIVNIAAAREARDERDDVQRARGAVRARPVERLRKRSPVSGMLIRRTRLDREMTQAEFGALIGVSDATVSSWELGQKRPTGLQLRELLRVLSDCGVKVA